MEFSRIRSDYLLGAYFTMGKVDDAIDIHKNLLKISRMALAAGSYLCKSR
jgi:hypothetical protein